MSYEEYCLQKISDEIKKVCIRNDIDKIIEKDAMFMYEKINEKVNRIGSYRKGIIAASLYFACMKNKEPRSIKEVSSYFELHTNYTRKGIVTFLEIYKTVDAITRIENITVV
jgi:transcription initiation factor TFIIIB Brf1 subunit/transcription initiation factor TFIIB